MNVNDRQEDRHPPERSLAQAELRGGGGAFDGNDMATSVTDLAPLLPSMLPDGGAGVPPTAIPHAAAIADAEGTLAFLAPDGRIGVMTAARGVSTTGEAVCARAFGRNPTPATGVMAPAAEGGIFVQCEGILARVDGKTDR